MDPLIYSLKNNEKIKVQGDYVCQPDAHWTVPSPVSSAPWEGKCSAAQISTLRRSCGAAARGWVSVPVLGFGWRISPPGLRSCCFSSSWELLCLTSCPSDFSGYLSASPWASLQSELLFLQFLLLEDLACVPLCAAVPARALPGMGNTERFLTWAWWFLPVSLWLDTVQGLCALIADPLKCLALPIAWIFNKY